MEGAHSEDFPRELLSSEWRRVAVRHLMRTTKASEWFACRVTGQHRSTSRRPPATTTDAGLCAWLRACQGSSPAWVSSGLSRHPRRGLNVNHKKIQRPWRAAGLCRNGADASAWADLNDTEPANRRRTEHDVGGGLQFDATTAGRPIKIVSIVDGELEHHKNGSGRRFGVIAMTDCLLRGGLEQNHQDTRRCYFVAGPATELSLLLWRLGGSKRKRAVMAARRRRAAGLSEREPCRG